MGRLRRLPRLSALASAGRRRVQDLAGDDRVVAAAAAATTIVAAWRLTTAMSVSVAVPAAPGAVPAAVPATAAALAPVPRVRIPRPDAPVRSVPVGAGPAHNGSLPAIAAHTNDEVQRAIQRQLATDDRRLEFEGALGRMGAFAPMIRATLRDRGVPQELLYLAMIESSYKPGAVSRAGATGMWQFMRGTAALYGLEVSAYVDERRDPVRSTQAAVRHLDDLHREFGSWHLALAAYNAGPPRVQRALRRHAGARVGDERLYWRIRPHLPAETREYVPLFLAAAEIARRPSAYGLSPAPTKPPLAFREVWYPGGTPLAGIARSRGLPVDQVLALNPHLVRGTTPPGRAWPVRLPLAPTLPHSAPTE